MNWLDRNRSYEESVVNYCLEADLGQPQSFENLVRAVFWNFSSASGDPKMHLGPPISAVLDFGGYISPFLPLGPIWRPLAASLTNEAAYPVHSG
jgi:hypothetical protein